jgi:PKHD-type hydroxylase
MKHNNTFWFWEGYVAKETCNSFVTEYYKSEKAYVAGYGKGYNNEFTIGSKRDTKICVADPTSYLGLFLFNNILIANQQAGWNYDISQIDFVQIGEYSIGGHYDLHRDDDVYSRDGTGIQRKLSLSLLLSDPDTYEGGDLLFDGKDEPVTRKQGSIIVFPSCVPHAVTPVTSGVRYSAVAWARGPYFK